MIPLPTMDVQTIESDMDGESIEMTIDSGSLSHIMSVLTDLYSDPILACVREYSTNARDSHIEAGVPNVPIEIVSPTRLSPSFKIRDFGVGLSVEDIRNVYSKYGSSTKRNSNDVNGMLGLGAKAALTYTASFTVVSVKDGMKNVVSVGRNAEGGGYMEIVDTFPTDMPSGVEVQIPVPHHQVSAFGRKIKDFFEFWEPGTVKIDGVLNEGLSDNYVQMDKEGRIFFTRNTGQYGNNIIVMGGVAYEAPFSSPFHYSNGFVYFAEMGEVSFSPSRESLFDNSKNREVFDKVVAAVKSLAVEKVSADIAQAANRTEAFKIASHASGEYLRPILGSRLDPWSHEYKGKPLSEFRGEIVKVAKRTTPAFRFRVKPSGEKVLVSEKGEDDFDSTDYSIRIDAFEDSVAQWFLGADILLTGVVDDILVNGGRRSAVMRGLRYLGYEGKVVVGMSNGSKINSVLDGTLHVVSLDEVREASKKALKEIRSNNPKPKRAKPALGSADVISTVSHTGVMETSVEKIDPKGNKVVHIPRGDVRTGILISGYNSFTRSRTFNKIMNTFDDYTFVAVPESGEAKFKEAFPNAQSYFEFIKDHSGQKFINEVVRRGEGKITANDVKVWSERQISGWRDNAMSRQCANLVDGGFVTDGVIMDYVNARKGLSETARVAEAVEREWSEVFEANWLRQFVEENGSVDKNNHVPTLLSKVRGKYPLLSSNFHDSGLSNFEITRHVAAYIAGVDSGTTD